MAIPMKYTILVGYLKFNYEISFNSYLSTRLTAHYYRNIKQHDAYRTRVDWWPAKKDKQFLPRSIFRKSLIIYTSSVNTGK